MKRLLHIPHFGRSHRESGSSKDSGAPRHSAFPADHDSAPSPHSSGSDRPHRRHESSSRSDKGSVTFAASRIDEDKLINFCNRNYGKDYILVVRKL
ncbi:hypothetical protein SAMD00023353_1801260 [Rosellinia necatrix]|uniref:Uncharacterized protein n=1 Tax=Rosellinia necatrix TaxID=77044 RepID=A0A1S8A7E9_ROSNE|nr:hypothetical protein SAMD00023353_1801260 [Rosellinia necatrix]